MAHQTRNSRDSSYSQASSAPPTTGEENTSQPAASAATRISSHEPSAEFIATVVRAVQSTLATSPPVSSVSASMSMIAAPAVGAQVSGSLSSGVPNVAVEHHLAGGPTSLMPQGRSPIVVPSFVNTFTLPVVSPALSRPSAVSVPILLSSDSLISNMEDINLPMLTFQQPFVLGPGFSPVPAKVVAQIVVGKFIPLADLLADNLTQHDPEPQLLFDGS